ncbi:MAG: phosphoribosylformimino-5-aminoimidazole carboxamide ribotide isomerase [Bacteroidales bacterium]|nr:phosphoribosylformimino-5-aminoimidazole carboxamide ribotide isomerase [Bacteroidales bacterium]MCM1417013.1 phosphoribosylformimino-5-aminoimidazole carboxamide ribotide isomerase [bacterium]MCM1424285.1 phosphoribosylformimino-5-aminoimidazole carboxamide ribotide isomerase [bacterium]
MKFRPCIDIHNGAVKQIVGGSLTDAQDAALENFVSTQDAAFYAALYRERGLKGGHVILLNPASSPYYEETKRQALSALRAYPGGLQAGGGITPENAAAFLEAGASHVIVTSYVFHNGIVDEEKLCKLKKAVGKERLVLDLSVRRRGERYYIVTDRWQKETSVELTAQTLDRFAESCDEFLIHAVDVEGKAAGIEESVAALLGSWGKQPVTYAGGVHSFADLDRLRELGRGSVDVTIGSALDLFGGPMAFEEVLRRLGQTDRA